jgi:hypothetical protein
MKPQFIGVVFFGCSGFLTVNTINQNNFTMFASVLFSDTYVLTNV